MPATAPAGDSPADRGGTLVAGIGNTLRGDDGFGVVALEAARQKLLGVDAVTFFEAGIAGVSLAQKLAEGFRQLIVHDAVDRGQAAGTLVIEELDLGAIAAEPSPVAPANLHQIDPAAVLRLAAAMDGLPQRAWVIGCQGADWDELGASLSPPVARAIAPAVERVRGLVVGESL